MSGRAKSASALAGAVNRVRLPHVYELMPCTSDWLLTSFYPSSYPSTYRCDSLYTDLRTYVHTYVHVCVRILTSLYSDAYLLSYVASYLVTYTHLYSDTDTDTYTRLYTDTHQHLRRHHELAWTRVTPSVLDYCTTSEFSKARLRYAASGFKILNEIMISVTQLYFRTCQL